MIFFNEMTIYQIPWRRIPHCRLFMELTLDRFFFNSDQAPYKNGHSPLLKRVVDLVKMTKIFSKLCLLAINFSAACRSNGYRFVDIMLAQVRGI